MSCFLVYSDSLSAGGVTVRVLVLSESSMFLWLFLLLQYIKWVNFTWGLGFRGLEYSFGVCVL